MAIAVEKLEREARAGDAQAFGALIRHFDQDLRGVAWAVVRTAHGTDDVMQAAYEKAFRAIGSFDGRAAFKTWLHTIVHRTAIDHLRYENRRRHEEIDEADRHRGAGATGGEQAGVHDRMELTALLDELDPDQRVALMLTTGLGYSYDEAAEILGEARGTVASRVNRARKRLRGGRP